MTSAPIIGAVWDPVVDHTTFATGAVVDVLVISGLPANVPTPVGTVLCNLPGLIFVTTPSGTPFAVPIPPDCLLLGRALSTQAASVTPSPVGAGLDLTNALDTTIGTF